MNDENAIALEAKGITKHFGGIHALEQVDFELRQSEVMGLVGDNGAGKSTLMNILTGVYPPTQERFSFKGKKFILGIDNTPSPWELRVSTKIWPW